MDDTSIAANSAFSSVASGQRPRARWLTPQGWVRAQRSTEDSLILAGPADELQRICSDHRRDWSCPQAGPAGAPRLYQGHRGAAELILVRNGSAAFGPRF